MDTKELAAEWLDHIANREQLSPLTVRMYKSSITNFVSVFADLVVLEPEDVEVWAYRDRRGRKPAAATARRDLVTAKKFLEWCFARKRIDCRAHISVVMPKVKAGIPRPISDAHWLDLWSSDMALDDRLWLGLAYWCGLRRYEIVSISPGAVAAAEGQLQNFPRKGGKTKVLEYRATINILSDKLPHLLDGGVAWMALLESIASAREGEKHLSIYSTADDPFLDGNRLTKRFGNVLLPNAGIPSDAFTIHQLRHSCATNLWRAGLPAEDIKRYMSHSSLDTTEGYMDSSGYMERSWKTRSET